MKLNPFSCLGAKVQRRGLPGHFLHRRLLLLRDLREGGAGSTFQREAGPEHENSRHGEEGQASDPTGVLAGAQAGGGHPDRQKPRPRQPLPSTRSGEAGRSPSAQGLALHGCHRQGRGARARGGEEPARQSDREGAPAPEGHPAHPAGLEQGSPVRTPRTETLTARQQAKCRQHDSVLPQRVLFLK